MPTLSSKIGECRYVRVRPEEFKRRRTALRLSQETVAEMARVSPRQVYRLEKGQALPADEWDRIMAVLDTPEVEAATAPGAPYRAVVEHEAAIVLAAYKAASHHAQEIVHKTIARTRRKSTPETPLPSRADLDEHETPSDEHAIVLSETSNLDADTTLPVGTKLPGTKRKPKQE